MKHTEVGYNKEPGDDYSWHMDAWQKPELFFMSSYAKTPVWQSVSMSGYIPAGPSDNNNFFVSPQQSPDKLIKTLRYDVDENYITTLGINLQAGRNFSKDFATDSSAVILNETAAGAFGWGNEAVGHYIVNENHGKKSIYQVIGVVKDFNFRSLHEASHHW